MVEKKDKTERIHEIIEMAEKEGGKYNSKKLGYKTSSVITYIEEMSINVLHKSREERGKVIRKFLSKHPGIKEIIIQAHPYTYPYRPFNLANILSIDTFIKYFPDNKGFDHYEVTVRVSVKSFRVTLYERYDKSYYLRDGGLDKLIRFLEKNL